jgi:hypothetical protein
MQNFGVEKSSPQIWSSSVVFKKLSEENSHSTGENSPQSDHPDLLAIQKFSLKRILRCKKNNFTCPAFSEAKALTLIKCIECLAYSGF